MPPTTAPHLPRPITLIINGKSRRGQSEFDTAVRFLRQAGVPLGATELSRDKAHTERVLRREVAEGAQTVIVGGGDGTLSACAGFLVHTSVAMGVLPLGTGNTLARSLGIPLDLEGAAQTIAIGHAEPMDVGCVNGRVFLNSVTLGLSADIAHALDSETKKRLGLLAWPVIGARVLWKHRTMVVQVTSPNKKFYTRTHQLVVSNGRYIAGPIAAAPDASVQDSCLRVFVLGGSKFQSLARTAVKWLLGQHTTAREAHYFATRTVRVETIRRRVPADVDGEINEHTPLDLKVLPGALRVIVPRNFEADEV
ncbi:MAG: YegS/Rv2252/BmrU family lipid kinase [Abitibacteriaceae bacterium]|nr:YegS/Rv2252/BmrU family lipid kinase [Abditibacteriaceae bacterium]